MKPETFSLLESYMSVCMGDSAHDSEHVRRVLYLALEIGSTEPAADRDVLIAACRTARYPTARRRSRRDATPSSGNIRSSWKKFMTASSPPRAARWPVSGRPQP